MESILKPGVKGKYEITVTFDDTAAKYGSGLLPVLATPALIAYMEKTCMDSVSEFLGEGQNTVGTEVCVKHLKATKTGVKATFGSELAEIEGNKLIFKVWASDPDGEIGTGTHTRFIIDTARFMAKL